MDWDFHKVALRIHPNIDYGHPCKCPWGNNDEHLGKTASKLDWLRERQDMQDDEGKNFLDDIERMGYGDADKLLPWIVREWRKKRLGFSPHTFGVKVLTPDHDEDYYPSQFFTSAHAKEIQDLLPQMKNHKQGIDVMQHKYDELMPKIENFKNFLLAKKRPGFGQVVHEFPDGWSIRRLQNAEEATQEGKDMGHCVGSYGNSIESGNELIHSLRDPNNLPHATIQTNPDHWYHPDYPDHEFSWRERDQHGTGEKMIPVVGPTSAVDQFYGKEDSPPLPEYADRVNDWLGQYGIETPPTFEPWWDDTYHVPAQASVPEYLNEYHFDDAIPDEYHQAMADAENNGVEGPELEGQDPDIESVWYDHQDEDHSVFDPDNAQRLHDTARDRGQLGAFHDEWKKWHEGRPQVGTMDPSNPAHTELNDYWSQAFRPHTNPDTGEFEAPRSFWNDDTGAREWETAMDRWWERKRWNYPQIPGADWGGQPMPEPMRQQVMTKIALDAPPPIYYRWVFSPETGQVEIGHNAEDHPANIRYHEELAGKLNRPNLVHGYAYRIIGGWRLTDYEHQPVDDPFVTSQVLRALGSSEPIQRPQEGSEQPSWEPAAHDFDALHYGLPQRSQD